MLFDLQMGWNIEGRISFGEVWDLEIKESKAAQVGLKIVGMYKVAGQKPVIALVDSPSADELDRTIMGKLPMREFLEFETIWPLRPFESFLEDCRTRFGAKDDAA